MADLLHELYEPLRAPGEAEHVLSVRAAGDGDRPWWEVHLDGVRVLRTRAASIAFRQLLWEANQQAIDRTTDRVLVHAAAAARGGDAVVIVGPMGAGKSTLVAALVGAGLGYLTDEVVALDPASGLVQPYPKYLSVGPALAHLTPPRPAAVRMVVGDQHLVPVAALRPDALAGPSRPRTVVLPRYEQGAGVTLTPIAPPDALSAVAEHAFHLDRDGPRVLRTVATMVEGATCWSLVSGDVDAARDALLEVVP
jgi:hypothetical protein